MRRNAQYNRRREVRRLQDNDHFTPYAPSIHVTNVQHSDEQDDKEIRFGMIEYIRTIIAVIRGQKDTKGNYTVGTFTFLLYFLFKFIGGLGMLSTTVLGIADVVAIVSYVSNGVEDFRLLIYFIIVFLLIVLVFTYSVMIWGAANEIEKETDKNYVLAVFSGVVSFASLVVAIVPLFREGN